LSVTIFWLNRLLYATLSQRRAYSVYKAGIDMDRITKKTFSIYWAHVRKYRWLFFVILFTRIAWTAVDVVIPLFFKEFFDLLSDASISVVEVANQLFAILGWIAVLFAVYWVLERITGFSNNYFQPTVIRDLYHTCFDYLHRHSFGFFQSNFVGSLVRRVNKFTRSFENMADRLIWNGVMLITTITLITAVLLYTHRLLGLIVLLWTISFLAVNFFISKYKFRYDTIRSEAESRATGFLADSITNNANIKLFGGLEREKTSFWDVNQIVRKWRMFTWNLDVAFEGIQGLLMMGLELSAFYIGIVLWQKGQFTIGDFVLIQSYLLMIFHRVWDFGKMIRYFFEDIADAKEMTEILDMPHEIASAKSAKALSVLGGAVRFDHVFFHYHKTRSILKDLCLDIHAGERVALVGPSGAGKSTVIKLLLRQHDVTRGRILVDDQHITKVTLESLWDNISLVPQDPLLFHRTLKENIRYGKPDATEEEVILAARLAHCHEFITEFSDGYDTYVGERGVKLSGGERQRVAIARAILRNAPILILDEATSSLDSESEKLIQDALVSLMKGKTVAVIAHRLSTIMKMDRIIVIDKGKIVEEGTHAQLLRKKKSVYKRLWNIQSGGFIE